LSVSLESRADSKTDSAKDALDIGIDLFPFGLIHPIFQIRGDRLSLKIGFYFSVMFKKGGHINNEIPDDREIGEGFKLNGFS
jgi:hypothetical protein